MRRAISVRRLSANSLILRRAAHVKDSGLRYDRGVDALEGVASQVFNGHNVL
jgi:hypothetical protein